MKGASVMSIVASLLSVGCQADTRPLRPGDAAEVGEDRGAAADAGRTDTGESPDAGAEAAAAAAHAFCDAHIELSAARNAECKGGELTYWRQYLDEAGISRSCHSLAREVALGRLSFDAAAATQCEQAVAERVCERVRPALGPWALITEPEAVRRASFCGGVFLPKSGLGEPCSRHSCAEGRCAEGAACPPSCMATTTATTGEFCDYLHVCSTGNFCVAPSRCQPPGLVGDRCGDVDLAICPGGSYCDAQSEVCTSVAAGGACNPRGLDGLTDPCTLAGDFRCSPGVGGATCMRALLWGAPCDGTRDGRCTDGLYCQADGSGEYACRGLRFAGEACERMLVCVSLKCTDGVCVGFRPDGAACFSGRDCESARCVAGRCEAGCG